MQRGNIPYKKLGEALKKLRTKATESLAETAGAVELDEANLELYELGEKRPPEDILRLLVTHFDIDDVEETELFLLGNYFPAEPEFVEAKPENASYAQQPAIMILPMDARIVYTDVAHVTVNKYGVVMNFMQNGGPGNQPLAVARVGMSLDHATKILEVLQNTLAEAKRANSKKFLPGQSKDQ